MDVKRGKLGSKLDITKSKSILASRKGQVTVFIIIGIVLLFVSAGIILITKKVTVEDITAEGQATVSSVPQVFQPIQSFTNDCLSKIVKEAVILIGEQGGYMDTKGKYNSNNPTDSDGVELGDVKVPYWLYNSKKNADNIIQFTSLKPKLHDEEDGKMSLESQIASYVKKNVDLCINNYKSFDNQGFKIQVLKEKDVVVKVGSTSVNTWLNMDVRAEKGSASQEFEQFFDKTDVPLKKLFLIAEEITDLENNFTFLEKNMMGLIVSYGGVDNSKLPPTEALTFDMVPKAFWPVTDVKTKIKSLLLSYVPLMRAFESNNYQRFEFPEGVLNPMFQQNYDNMIIPINNVKGINVNFDYFGWEPYIDLNDAGGVVKSNDAGASYGPFSFYTNHFYTSYDVSYPVLITLNDPNTFNGEGYNFVFALEANIRNNEPVKNNEELSPPVVDSEESMLCDKDKWDTEPIKSKVIDSSTRKPLAGVQVTFSIPGQGTCLMGSTNAEGIYEGPYPAVYGGLNKYAKESYLGTSYSINTYNNKKKKGVVGSEYPNYDGAVILLHKYHNINVTAQKRDLEKCVLYKIGDKVTMADILVPVVAFRHLGTDTDFLCPTLGDEGVLKDSLYSYVPNMRDEVHHWLFTQKIKKVSDLETVTFIFSRISDLEKNVLNEDFSASLILDGDSSEEISLLPGIYKISTLVTLNKTIVIPADERCSGGAWEQIGCFDTDGCCSEIEENVLNGLLLGQIEWNTEESYFKVTPEKLYGSNELKFTYLGANLENVPTKEQLRVIGQNVGTEVKGPDSEVLDWVTAPAFPLKLLSNTLFQQNSMLVIEDLQVMGQLGNLSRIKRSDLEPQFK